MGARRLMIVDDITQVRTDLRTLLELTGDIKIIGEASNGLEAINLATILKPEVILMDLEMPLMSGYEAARQIKEKMPACRVIALTVHSYPEAWKRASQSNMDAFIVKGEPLANLVHEILKEM